MNRLGSISETVGLIYVFAVIIGVIGIAVIFMRSDDDEATLPGFAFLAGILTLISPALSAYALYIEIAVFHTSEKSDFAKVGGQIAELGIYSIIVGAVALVVVSPIAFLPFSARVGKRLSPIFGIGSVLIGTMILVAITFWLVGFSQEPTNPVFGK